MTSETPEVVSVWSSTAAQNLVGPSRIWTPRKWTFCPISRPTCVVGASSRFAFRTHGTPNMSSRTYPSQGASWKESPNSSKKAASYSLTRVKAGDPAIVSTKLDERLELHRPSRREIGGSGRHDARRSAVCMCKVRRRASPPYGRWKPRPSCPDLRRMVPGAQGPPTYVIITNRCI
jgi:hypothetical protein